MPYWQPVFFQYADSGRAAVGLKVEAWRGETFLRATATDSQGFAGYYYTGERLIVKRGVYKFNLEPDIPDASYGVTRIFGLEPAHWPDKLKELRNALTTPRDTGTTPRDELVDAANRSLQALRDRGDIDQLTVPAQFADKTADDNPQIILGTLLPCMAISRLFAIDEGTRKYFAELPNNVERERLHAVKTGIHHGLLWLRRRQHPTQRGYFLRWQQTALDGRGVENDWKAEPSLDEYSGLLLALSSLHRLAEHYNYGVYNQWSSAIKNETRTMLSDISDYLVDSRGWLVRPTQRDLTVRGPDLIANAWPLFLILRGFGYWGFRNAKPMDLANDERQMIDRSQASLAAMDPNSALGKRYKESVDLVKTIKNIDQGTEIVQWAAVVATALAFVFSPAFGLGFAFLGLAVYLGASYLDDKAVEMLDFEVWGLAGQLLGPPAAVDAGGYNTHIFDRFCLAASWSGNSANFNAFSKRAQRPFGGDSNGWRSLGIGSRVWMGVDFNPDTMRNQLLVDVDAAMPNDGSSPQPGLRTLEGFVLGWSLIALALDLDPEIRWEECISARNDWDAPTELPSTQLPRFRFLWKRLLVNETREHGDVYTGEEPYLWIIPVILTEGAGTSSYRFLPTYTRPFQHADTGDVFNVNYVATWGIDPIQLKTHVLAIVVAWEADFTSAEDRLNALAKTRSDIQHELDSWQPELRTVEELAEHIGGMLRWQLPHYYRYSEAQPGYRQSDDDFVGASVVHGSAEFDTNEFEREFHIRLFRQPKPRPRFTDLTVEATISFRNLV